MRILIGGMFLLAALLMAGGLWIPAKAWAAQLLLTQAWATTSTLAEPQKPWPWSDTWPIARLHFVAQGQSYVVLKGVDGGSLAFAPGHLTTSAAPGSRGTVVIAGHRDTHFRLLESIRIADRLLLESALLESTLLEGALLEGAAMSTGRSRQLYQVTDISVVNSETTRLALDTSQDRLVLVTCFPFNGLQPNGPLRYVVTAKAVDAT